MMNQTTDSQRDPQEPSTSSKSVVQVQNGEVHLSHHNHADQSNNSNAANRIVQSSSSTSEQQQCCSLCSCISSLFSPSPPSHPPTPEKPGGREIIRLLMVGKGDVGKSTVIKQLQNLCSDRPEKYVMFDETWTRRIQTFTIDERRHKKQEVLRNILHCIGTLLNKVEDFGLEFDSDENRDVAQRVRTHIGDVDQVLQSYRVDFTPEIAREVARLWKDTAVQKAWDRRREYIIPDHATEYFLKDDKLEKIAEPEYVPTAEDILSARNPTRGTRDYNFEIEGTKFSFRDMGGQPAELARFPVVVTDWLNECEENTRKYVLFVASLADYNQRLTDRPKKYTKLIESIRLMEILMNIENLRNVGFILFLNKRDILEEKLNEFNDFSEHFPQALAHQHHRQHSQRGAAMPPIRRQPQPQQQQRILAEDAEKIIGAQFHSAAQNTSRRDRPLYMHFTCATDKAQMDGIIGAVRVDILFKYMQTGIPFP